jgi:hypothetical protein
MRACPGVYLFTSLKRSLMAATCDPLGERPPQGESYQPYRSTIWNCIGHPLLATQVLRV